MKLKSILFCFLMIVVSSCNTYKNANSALVSGNFDQAFEQSLEAYAKNPTDKNALKYLPLIHEAYTKAQDRDEQRIKELQNSVEPHKYAELYTLLVNLQNRQSNVKGVDNRVAGNKTYNFKTKDYSKAFTTVKGKYADYLYDEAKSWLAQPTKPNAKVAYQRLQLLESIMPNYSDARALMTKAKQLGTYKVLVQLSNDTQVIIPQRLEQELLDFNSYGLDSNWTEFYTGKLTPSYDYVIQLSFETIQISPEKEKLVVHNFEKKIQDGKEKLIQNGEVVVDKDGKPVMVDRFITVKSKFEEYNQIKEAGIVARYFLIDNQKEQTIESKPLSSSYVFANSFGKFTGDKRALDDKYIKISGSRPLPFPSNEQMIYDCGQDLKAKFKSQIKRMKL